MDKIKFKSIDEEHKFNDNFIKKYNVKEGSKLVLHSLNNKYKDINYRIIVTSINPYYGWVCVSMNDRFDTTQIDIQDIVEVDGEFVDRTKNFRLICEHDWKEESSGLYATCIKCHDTKFYKHKNGELIKE